MTPGDSGTGDISGFDERSLALLCRGSTILVTAIGLAVVVSTITRGIGRAWDEQWLNTLSTSRYALVQGALLTLPTACMLLGMLGWRDILRADARRSIDERRPARFLASLIGVTVVLNAITTPLNPVGEYLVAFTESLEHHDLPNPSWMLPAMVPVVVIVVVGMLLVAVRYFAGVVYLGNLGGRLGIARHPASARRLTILSASIPASILISMGAMLIGPAPVATLGLIVIILSALLMLVAIYKYARLINAIRVRAKLALALHRDGTLPLDTPTGLP